MVSKLEFTISRLAKIAGVTPRTIRYYVAEGLLPPTNSRGRYTRYTDVHLVRLQLIQRFKEAFLPLATIRDLLQQLNDEQINALLSKGVVLSPPTPGSIGDILARTIADRKNVSPDASEKPLRALLMSAHLDGIDSSIPLTEGGAHIAGGQKPVSDIPFDTWQRVVLAPGIELHVQASIIQHDREYIDRLITAVRTFFDKDSC